MADILTNLRELSVAFFLLAPDEDPLSIKPPLFTETCNKNITNCHIAVRNIASNNSSFSDQEVAVMKNGLKLAIELRKILKIAKPSNIEWVGHLKQSDSPEDLIVNGHKLSLKEESYILENMGLYKLLDIILGSEVHKHGLHVFETFSKDKLDKWYETTRDLLIKLGPSEVTYNGSEYTSNGTLIEDTLTLSYKGNIRKIENFSGSTYDDFQSKTDSKTREKVFAKWIKEKVERSQTYINSKSECAKAAGDKIVSTYGKFIGTSSAKLLRLFRIHEYPYYYAKTTSSSVRIYYVPSVKESIDKIIINKFYYEVPFSQLNIYTEILNTQNGSNLLFRNELRYSHGQLNGTPEAKLYHGRDGDLSIMYMKLL